MKFYDEDKEDIFGEVFSHIMMLAVTGFVLCMIITWIWACCFVISKASGSEIEKPRYGFKFHEKVLLAQLISGDYRKDGDGEYDIDFQSEPNLDEAYKVLCVVMNRQRHARWPAKVKDIVLAPGQFHVFPRNLDAIPSAKAFTAVYNWCKSYDNYVEPIQVIPDNHVYFAGDGTINRTRRNY